MPNQRVLKRFLILCVVGSLLVGGGVLLYRYYDPPPGDYQTRQGDIHLGIKEYDLALEDFNRALEIMPNHRGALMGRAIVFLETGQAQEAERAFKYLIDFLEATLEEDDLTGRATLAASYANLGIFYDRKADYQQALHHYYQALRIDEETVAGPGIVHKILYEAQPSTIKDRALYITQQLRLPEEDRVLTNPEYDQRQRMYKP